jgi:hypothetical protein
MSASVSVHLQQSEHGFRTRRRSRSRGRPWPSSQPLQSSSGGPLPGCGGIAVPHTAHGLTTFLPAMFGSEGKKYG